MRLIAKSKALALARMSLKHYWIYGLLVFSAVAGWVAMTQTKGVIQAIKDYSGYSEARSAAAEIFSIHKIPATDEEYVALVRELQQENPMVEFNLLPGKGVTIDTQNIELYPEWAYAINRLYSARGGWLWSTDEICLGEGKCPKPLHIHVTALRQEIVINAQK